MIKWFFFPSMGPLTQHIKCFLKRCIVSRFEINFRLCRPFLVRGSCTNQCWQVNLNCWLFLYLIGQRHTDRTHVVSLGLNVSFTASLPLTFDPLLGPLWPPSSCPDHPTPITFPDEAADWECCHWDITCDVSVSAVTSETCQRLTNSVCYQPIMRLGHFFFFFL